VTDDPRELLPEALVLEVQEHYVTQHFAERKWRGAERRQTLRWRRHQSPLAQLAKKKQWPHVWPRDHYRAVLS
jgi:hypothetical protein